MNLASGQASPSSTRRNRVSVLALVLTALLGTLLMLTMPEKARAHPALDAAISHAEEADFDEALSEFDAALSSGELTRDELVVLVSQRALVFHALGRDAELSRDLSLLAMLAPDHQLGRAAPPPLVARWNELRTSQGAPASVRGSCAPTASGAQINAQVEGVRDPELGQVFIHTHNGENEWVQKQAASVDISSGDDGSEYYVEIRGPGGVALASDGSAEAPHACANFSPSAAVGAGGQPPDDKKRNKKLWWWLGGTALVVGAAAAVVVVLTTRDNGQSDRTVVSKPMVTF
jgi:hypothetical protein